MTTPLNIVENVPANGKFHLDGQDYYVWWHMYRQIYGYSKEQFTEDKLEKLQRLAKELIYPALQLHSLGLDYLWDRKKKEYIPFKKYSVQLWVATTDGADPTFLKLRVECHKPSFSYRSMNHIRRYMTLAKERNLKIQEALRLFDTKACELLDSSPIR